MATASLLSRKTAPGYGQEHGALNLWINSQDQASNRWVAFLVESVHFRLPQKRKKHQESTLRKRPIMQSLCETATISSLVCRTSPLSCPKAKPKPRWLRVWPGAGLAQEISWCLWRPKVDQPQREGRSDTSGSKSLSDLRCLL